MAKTNKLTIAQTLDVVNEVAQLNPDVFADALARVNPDATTNEFAAKVEHMHMNAFNTTTRKTPKTPTKTQIENQNLAKQVLNSMTPETVLTLKWITTNIPFVNTSQKARAVVNVLLKSGEVVKTEPVNGHVAYRLSEVVTDA